MLRTLLVCVCLLYSTAGYTQETKHPDTETKDPYSGLLDKDGVGCCHSTHCRPALHQTRADGHWMSTNGGEHWFKVPAEKEVLPTKEVEQLGGATWCGTAYAYEKDRVTMCWVRENLPSI